MLMNKRILLLLTVFLCSFISSLQAENWGEGGKIAADFSNKEAGKLTIMDAKELALLAKIVNEGGTLPSTNIELGDDIYLTGGLWIPIGTDTHPFIGRFDGAGYKIEDLNVSEESDDNVGLFGVAGTNDSSVELKKITLTSALVNGKTNVGALVGLLVNGSVLNCVNNKVNVTGSVNVGGLVGSLKKGSVNTSYNAGDVTGDAILGGLVGLVSNATVSQSYNVGKVYGKRESIGGIVGSLIANGIIENVYNVGKVDGGSKTGGIVGNIITSTCRNTYNLSEVDGSSYYGSIAGDNNSGTLTGNLYDNQLTSLAAIGGEAKDIAGQAEGKATKELIDTFTSASWVVEEGMYPRLLGLAESEVAIVNATPITQLIIGGPGVAKVDAIIANFSLPLKNGVTWTSDKEAVEIASDGEATVKRSTQTNIRVVLTVKKGDESRSYNVVVAQRIVYPVTLSVRESEKANITITAVTEAEPLGENKYQLDKGASFIFKVKWPEYYESVDVLVDDVKVTLGVDGTYEIRDIQSAKTVVVKGELKRYNVSVTATSGGTVTVLPALQDGTAAYGTTLTLTASPNEFYQLNRWDPTGEKTKTVTVVVKSETTYEAVFTEMPTSKVVLESGEGVSISVSNYPLEETIKDLEVFYENLRGYEIIRQGSLIRFKVGVLAQYNSENMKVTLVNGTVETQLKSDPYGIYEVKGIENNIKIRVTGVTQGGFKLTIPDDEDIKGGIIDIYPLQDSYDYGTEVRVSAVADEDYVFEKWSNGVTTSVFYFNVTGDMILPTPQFTSTVANEPIVANVPHIYTRGNTICIQRPEGTGIDVSVVNIIGTVVIQKRILNSTVEINVAHKGIYVVSVGKHVEKVVVR